MKEYADSTWIDITGNCTLIYLCTE